MSLLEEYRSGTRDEAYAAALAGKGMASDQKALADEIMTRVRANLEALAQRWHDRGHRLDHPLGPPDAAAKVIARYEARHRPLPPTLRALYAHVGQVDFCGWPSPLWSDRETIDPLVILDPTVYLREMADDRYDDLHNLPLFTDPLTKMGYSGLGGVAISLPDPVYNINAAACFDPVLEIEGIPVRGPDGEALRLVPYLRRAILELGGFTILTHSPEPGERADLVRGLQPF